MLKSSLNLPPTIVSCRHCGKPFKVQGIGRHEKACEQRRRNEQRNAEIEQRLTEERSRKRARYHTPDLPEDEERVEQQQYIYAWTEDYQNAAIPDDANGTNIDQPGPSGASSSAEGNRPYQPNDVKIFYHPNSKRATKILNHEEYRRTSQTPRPQPDERPWRPFRSRGDFEFAELALDAGLNNPQTDAFLAYIRRLLSGTVELTLQSSADLNKVWESASDSHVSVTVSTKYKDDTREYPFFYRPIWDWALETLRNPTFAPHFEWDAQKLYRFDGTRLVRFFDEPWTGDRWWEVQSALPENGKPFGFILFSDKTRLSSFGSEKGYPIIARIANLPVDIRNGTGLGGGRVVGWLPVIEEEAKETGKKGFVNMKQAVWHEAFWELLKIVAQYSTTGYAFETVEQLIEYLYPFIAILVSDYEEQCVMALIRGVKSLFPCPICLVPHDELANLRTLYPLRTAAQSQKVLEEARQMDTKAEGEALLMQYSLRDVENKLMTVANSDPHRALSFDRLHAYNDGLFGKHLCPEWQGHLEKLGRDAQYIVDKQLDMIPPWRGLNHFSRATTMTFADGSKYEDLAKVIIFASHNVMEESPAGYLLLRLIRSYLTLDVLLSFEVHTEETIKMGEDELLKFSDLLEAYAESYFDFLKPEGKNWNFPKSHSHRHAFDDIRAKGATRNMNTKTFETMHGLLKFIYQYMTNFKDVASQILKIDHKHLISQTIRDLVVYYDDFHRPVDEDDAELKKSAQSPQVFGHVIAGSLQLPESFSSIEERHRGNNLFKNFRTRLANYLSNMLPLSGIPLPNGRRIAFSQEESVTESRFIKVTYESMVDWKQKWDYLRCSPLFHNRERHDHVIVDIGDGKFIFAKLLFTFICQVAGDPYALALVHPLDAVVRTRRKDKELSFFRVNSKSPWPSEFVFLRSIVRGALVVEDYSAQIRGNEFFVVDVVDGDAFLRIRKIFRLQ
ncbi:hypothetical protein EUX98_g9164 [Antrodiella citrinella]|uniref:C2H2-type domain-containing protein n=1 Tax=Antrodiella citrinella TaxID=2447956 RepID=A0A4S4LXS8_9APHY|nr:hypothetical protein EUX98_g9164 [Antrodiella citrinella]